MGYRSLDGTTSFIKRLPHFAVSIAVRIKGRTEVAGSIRSYA